MMAKLNLPVIWICFFFTLASSVSQSQAFFLDFLFKSEHFQGKVLESNITTWMEIEGINSNEGLCLD